MERLTETRDGRNVIPLRYGSFEWTLETHCTPECLKERFLSGYPADRLAAYEDTGLEPDEMASLRLFAASADHDKAMRLLELSKADSEGRLAILPCKEGTKCYRIVFGLSGNHRIEERYFSLTYNRPEDFGKSMFLTREEAEAALKGGADDVEV